MGISLQPLANINPGVVSGGVPPALDPVNSFVQAYLAGQHEKRQDSRSSAANKLEEARIALMQKQLDHQIAQTEHQTTVAQQQGELARIFAENVFPHMVASGAINQFLPQMGGGMGSAPDGGAAMAGLGAAQQMLPQTQGQVFTSAMARMSPDAVAAFTQQSLPNLTKLADDVRAMKAAKTQQASDEIATQALVRLGLAVPGTVVPNASKELLSYQADVKKSERDLKAKMAEYNAQQAAAAQKQAVEGLQGTAMELARMNPDWSPSDIKRALKATPTYKGIADGVVAKAAIDASDNAKKAGAPQNETQAKARLTYGPGRAALATVNALDSKGNALGVKAFLAGVDEKQTGIAAGALGSGMGTMMAPGVGTAVGGLVGGGIGIALAPILRTTGRKLMSPDEQRLFTAAENVAAMVYRGESGGSVTPAEMRQAIERYIPLSTDSPGNKKLKRQLRAELDKTVADISGLPQQLAQPILDQLLSKHEQRLSAAGVTLTPAQGNGTGTTAQF